MGRYSSVFGERDRVVGQVLLTRDVLAHRGQYLHAREALEPHAGAWRRADRQRERHRGRR